VLLEAGCSAYLGTLWDVNDLATLLLMVLFFQHIRQCIDDTHTDRTPPLAEMWRRALGDFYNIGATTARQIIRNLITLWKEVVAAGKRPNEIVQGELVYLTPLAEEPAADDGDGAESTDDLDLDYQHPFLYASFTLVGNGSLRLFQYKNN
jgi:CHAT domain-containing protein